MLSKAHLTSHSKMSGSREAPNGSPGSPLFSALLLLYNLERGRGLPGETPEDACTPGLWDQGMPAPQASGIRGCLHPQPLGSGDACTLGLWDSDLLSMDNRPQALWVGTPSPQTRCSCGHCTEVSLRLLAWVLGNSRKSKKLTQATLRLESLTHSSLKGGNVTEAGMGTTLSKWTSGKVDILGMGQP